MDLFFDSAAGEEKLEKYLQAALQLREEETGYPFFVYDKKNEKSGFYPLLQYKFSP